MTRGCCRAFAVFFLLVCCFGLSGFSFEFKSDLSRERTVVQSIRPGGYRWMTRQVPFKDPVKPLEEGDLALFKGGLSKSEVDGMLKGYVDRMTDTYAREFGFPEELTKFLKENDFPREVFVTALNPRYDDIKTAARIFEELRAKDEKKLKKYAHLGTAFAVVYDTPDTLKTGRYFTIWGCTEEQFRPLPEYLEMYEYYTKSSHARYFAFSLHKLPWPILIHLVNNDASAEERRWATAKYNKRTDIAKLYSSMRYDNSKLNRTGSRLGNRPYVLHNLLQYGGICGDQAYFTSRVAKSLGIPAMKVSGQSRYGGIGHSWAGFLVIRKGRPFLEFTGRFFFDYYYTGDIFDPQTRTLTLDRYVAMMYDGASLSYKKYNQSQMMVRMAEVIKDEHPEESLELTCEALKLNYFNMWGWPLLMEHIKEGTMSKEKGLKWFNDALRALKEHPDMTFECLGPFVECLPRDDLKGRQSLYNQTFGAYKKRPDLQLKLRMSQAEELVAAGKKLPAINVLCGTIVQHAKEGTLVLPAMELAVKIATELRVQPQAYAILKRAEGTFPKTRQGQPSQAYAEFKSLLGKLQRR